MDVRANLLVDSVSLGVVLLVALGSELIWKHRDTEYQKRFRRLLIAVCVILTMDLLAWLCEGKSFPNARAWGFAVNTGYLAAQIIECWLWARFVFDWTKGFRGVSRWTCALFAVPLLAELTMLALNVESRFVFTLTPQNRYMRGPFYAYSLIPYALYIAVETVVLIRSLCMASEDVQKRRALTLIIGTLLPTIGNLIEIGNYGMSFTWPLAAISLLLLYLSAQQEQSAMDQAEAAKTMAQLSESRVAIMLSQIQPHFLYNSLTVISELCEIDPVKARYATLQFSAFLRGNMNSLTMNKPIAFEHELQHTKNYLELEKLRFQERLRLVFEIETTLFQLPTLTLQPIVENAVRYGVTKRPEGGTVTIRTEERPNCFVVTVSDDGVGFDPMLTREDGRTHIGISNVRDRLKRMVNGTLDITSTPNVGTVAVLTIPKGEVLC